MPQQTIAPDAIIEIVMWQTLDTSRILNIYHFKRPDGGATIVNGDDFLTAAATELWSRYYNDAGMIRALTHPNLRYDFARAQVVAPTRQYYMPVILGFNGTADANKVPLPSDVQLCMTYRSNRVGRGVNGRKAYAGLMTFNMSGSLWVAQTKADWNGTIAPVLKANLTVTGEDLIPIIWNPRHPSLYSTIAAIICQEEVRVQRRRQFRLGI